MYRSSQNQNYFVVLLVSFVHSLVLGIFLLGTQSRVALDFGSMAGPILIDLHQAAKFNNQSNKVSSQVIANNSQISNPKQLVDPEGVFPRNSLGFNGTGIEKSLPVKIDGPKPHYPLVSRRLKEEGLVMVSLCIDSAGGVEKVGIVQSSGYRNLDNSAINALSKWRFSTASEKLYTDFNRCFRLPVRFTLESE